MTDSQWPININENSWQQPESPISDLFNSDSEPIPVLQKYSDVRPDKQLIMNTSNPDEGSLQSDHLTTGTGLFRIHINIDFPPFGINMGTSGLRSVLETTKITGLK